MNITITPEEAMDRMIWEEVCDIKGINPWAVNEGQMDSDDAITLSEEEARKLHLLPQV
jgi:hypothetical protein